jgi:hypothetical protein
MTAVDSVQNDLKNQVRRIWKWACWMAWSGPIKMMGVDPVRNDVVDEPIKMIEVRESAKSGQ